MITQHLLSELFYYSDGHLYRKVSKGYNAKAGYEAGWLGNNGYRSVSIQGKKYLTHRVIFLLLKGYLPKYIDHVDGDRLNNRIENLRECTAVQNLHNARIRSDNICRRKGVYLHKHSGLYHVRLKFNGKVKSFGYYKDLELAALVAEEARNKYHGEFARHF